MEKILKKMWIGPVFLYSFGNGKFFLVGDEKLSIVSQNGLVIGAYSLFCSKSDEELLSVKIVGKTSLLQEIMSQMHHENIKTEDYSQYIQICNSLDLDVESLKTQYDRIDRLRKGI